MSDVFSHLFGLTQEALDACAREPIHIPGSIQPRGVLLIATPDTLVITQISINCSDLLGYEPTQLLGQPLAMLFPPTELPIIEQTLRKTPPGVVAARSVTITVRGIEIALFCQFHTYQGLVLLELLAEEHTLAAEESAQYVPLLHADQMQEAQRRDLQRDLTRSFSHLAVNLTLDAPLYVFCQQVVDQVRELTGYDRVMIYQFDEVGNGEVIAEARAEQYEPFLHLCYPAADIPPQARLLYLRNRVRALGDIYYQPVPILPRHNPETHRDPDLSLCLLRSFSPVHLEYLHNMGVRATLTVSIIEQGRLWGLIACHHYQPKWPTHILRLTCDLLSELISMQVTMLGNYLRVQATARAQTLQHELIRYLASQNDWLTALASQHAQLLGFVDADGAAVCRGSEIVTIGETPPTAAIREIVLWLQTTIPSKVLVTDGLGALNRSFAPFAATVSGLIALEIARNEGGYLLWFRRERIQTITWGGNPAEKMKTVDGETRLRPRASFAAWQTEMRGRSLPWPAETQYLVEALRVVLVEIVLELLSQRHILTSLDLMRVRRAVEAISEPLAITDEHGTILFMNQALVKLTGYEQSMLPNPEGLEQLVVNPHDTAAIRANRQQGWQTWQGEIELRQNDGTVIPVNVRIDPVLDMHGQPIGQIRLYTDLRASRQAEEERRRLDEQIFQMQKLESLGILAGSIAHDFNNLLTAMLGHANLAVLDLPPESPARESIRQIEIAAQRAAELSNQMLAYSGRGRFVVQAININVLVTELAHLLNTAVSKNALLKFDLAPRLPAVEADVTQLRQVVMNLITNASDAIGDQPGTITLITEQIEADARYLAEFSTYEMLKAGPYVLLSVEDTGKGMDGATLRRIFEPFFTTKFTGRGLGLAAVQGIVRGHKGAIQVQSTPGQGTTFRVLLPAIGKAFAERRQNAELKVVGNGQTVLVIDDEQGVREFTQRVLERGGFHVLLAESGIAGIELLQRHSDEVQLVLLDLTMPQMSGRDVYKALRKIKPNLPIVLCSGYTPEEVVRVFAEQQLAGFVQKPFRAAELLQTIEKLM